jgi:MOSC domain-containing protein YiiM
VATILTLQVGPAQTHAEVSPANPRGQEWFTGIFKSPVAGPLWLDKINLAEDDQADRINHGGVDKAVLAYGIDRYDYWRSVLPDVAWVNGGFGENFTISEQTEDNVCIGDIYAIGEGENAARVQVSQPRTPCYKLARRWGVKDLTACVQVNGYGGWYLRVLQEGEVVPGMALHLLERPYPQWTIAQVHEVANGDDPEQDLALAACEALSEGWRVWLVKRAQKQAE